jgi:hypothetical protein
MHTVRRSTWDRRSGYHTTVEQHHFQANDALRHVWVLSRFITRLRGGVGGLDVELQLATTACTPLGSSSRGRGRSHAVTSG